MNRLKVLLKPRFFIPLFILVLGMSGLLAWRFWSSKEKGEEYAPPGTTDLGEGISVEVLDSSYKVETEKPSGWFQTGQEADIMLSGVDFNNTGGPLLFNHPGNVASDGTHLLLADRNNNRVLIWNTLPQGNTPPDLVLGQKDFTTNNPGTGLSDLNWPVGVATDGKHVIVADTYNDRILIWNSFPTSNGAPADLELKDDRNNPKRSIGWPWAVWSNGEKMIVTSTAGSKVLIWESIPTANNEGADIVLSAGGNFGTPRSIGSDGAHLVIGDHNAKVVGGPGNFFWKTFPTKADQPYDFFLAGLPSGVDNPPPQPGGNRPGELFWGNAFTAEGKFLAIAGSQLAVWNSFPAGEKDAPDLIVGGTGPQQNGGFGFLAGDGSGMALASDTLYIPLSNGNKIAGFKGVPESRDALPDFAIGAPDIYTNTLEEEFIMSNPVVATDGKSLFISSDFDRKLYVYKNLPDESGAKPDLVYNIGGWDNELWGNIFTQVNQREVYIWKSLPTEPRKPDLIFKDKVGSVALQESKGVALDDKYFYLSDAQANKVYVWEGLPDGKKDPKFVLSVNQPRRLSSDGKYLVVTTTLDNESGHVKIFKIAELSNDAQPTILQRNVVPTNLPEYATVSHGALFVGDTGFNRVLIWKKIEDALSGKVPEVVLGAPNLQDIRPEIGKDKLFWPAAPAFDGSYLWVGEFKFSERILRFSVR